ncbi:MAG: hypothetical protein QOJ52_3102 [Acidimicrobiaceae bacterium]|jgi:hypothetical protein|nr:hypothetical protein [Acidimicrobiaceae bacterium]MDQ1421140.1 hypothetical protein [Acidimicrobiaceae bacterium]MDQ1443511.1 hypothetical protein [Acidimicrobiaceae bacterium]
MGEIFNALEVLNRTMNLGLSSHQLLGAEMGFKSALAMQGNPDPTHSLPTDAVELAQGYEVVATLRPRAEKLSLEQLSTFAQHEVNKPRITVDAAMLTHIGTALQATSNFGETIHRAPTAGIRTIVEGHAGLAEPQG